MPSSLTLKHGKLMLYFITIKEFNGPDVSSFWFNVLDNYLVTMPTELAWFVACYGDTKSIALSGILEAGMLVCQDWQEMQTGAAVCDRLSL